MRVDKKDRQSRRCKCGNEMVHRYSYDFVRRLYRAQCVCDRCGRCTAVQYAERQGAAISAAYTTPNIYRKLID